jgi:hypothetical protein
MSGAGSREAVLLNGVAWAQATSATATPACLLRAEEAVNGALQQLPEQAGIIDTKATVYYREGRIDEAVALERAAIDLTSAPPFFSQLDRFLQRRSQLGGAVLIGPDAGEAKLTLTPPGKPRAIHVELNGFKYGGQIYARVVGAKGPLGLVALSFGWQHAPAYDVVPSPRDLPDDARLELALVDARGCDTCTPTTWKWELQPHDATIDALPR